MAVAHFSQINQQRILSSLESSLESQDLCPIDRLLYHTQTELGRASRLQ